MTDDVVLEQHSRELLSLRTRLQILQDRLDDALRHVDRLWAENIQLKKKLDRP